MLDLALQSPQELSCLAEHGQVEVVVIVSDADLSRGCQTNSDGEIGHTFSTYLSQIVALETEWVTRSICALDKTYFLCISQKLLESFLLLS